jgi:hypothetical protein
LDWRFLRYLLWNQQGRKLRKSPQLCKGDVACDESSSKIEVWANNG